ncbi:MAG TPA: hypothetical protein VEC02_07435 [Nitrososphaerales archaeon]|nr:hypothetical protein [Nitrososphaerales archaeon]
MAEMKSEIDESVLEEGCYYLSSLGLTTQQIAAHFETTPTIVRKLVSSYKIRLKSGEVVADDFDRAFWEGVRREAEGDIKVTFVSEKGFHHAWRSELGKLDGPALMSILEASKDFLNSDPNQKFLDYPAPKGYDPLALDREVRNAVVVVNEALERLWRGQRTREERRGEKVQG